MIFLTSKAPSIATPCLVLIKS